MSFRSRLRAWCAIGGIAVLLAGLAGCGGGSGAKVAPVKGKVTFEGQPIKGGSINFAPISAGAKEGIKGKPASGEVKDDGTFVLSCYGKDDGAVVGKHRVSFLPLSMVAKDYDDKPAPSPYLGCVPETQEVEVKPGPNEIEIKLVRGLGAAPAAPAAAPAAEKEKAKEPAKG